MPDPDQFPLLLLAFGAICFAAGWCVSRAVIPHAESLPRAEPEYGDDADWWKDGPQSDDDDGYYA